MKTTDRQLMWLGMLLFLLGLLTGLPLRVNSHLSNAVLRSHEREATGRKHKMSA
jgi:hypothetical protein